MEHKNWNWQYVGDYTKINYVRLGAQILKTVMVKLALFLELHNVNGKSVLAI